MPVNLFRSLTSLTLIVLLFFSGAGHAARAKEEINVAVASNFLQPAREVAAMFRKQSGFRLRLISGSTGKLYAQIVNGAPYQVFLAADVERPRLLESKGMAVAGSRFTYAIGRLALWSADSDMKLEQGLDSLDKISFRRLALANPVTAPYGAAARQVLEGRGYYEAMKDRLVFGENITQAWQFVATGNAQLGFVALSQVRDPSAGGVYWTVPQELHDPVQQQAVILNKGRDSEAAAAFTEFLRSDQVRRLLKDKYGYDS